MSDNKVDAEIKHMWDSVEMNGVAILSVDNGHILTFKKDFLQKLINNHPTYDHLTVFVQTANSTNTN